MTEICEHDIDPQMQVCRKCYLTAEEIAQGRDEPPSWYDVDYAYQEGRRLGIVIGEALYKKKRRDKLIEVGYYLCLRRLGKNVERRQ